MMGYVPSKFGDYFFDDIKEWIADNCEPDEVFNIRTLKEWVADNSRDLDVYTDDEVTEEINDYIKENGYVQEE